MGWIATALHTLMRGISLLVLLAVSVEAPGAQEQQAVQQLQRALQGYHQLRSVQGGWPTLRPGGRLLQAGMHDAEIAVLRRQLVLTGDLQDAPVSGDTFFDDGLAAAVRRFQLRHGLDPDGVVGPRTRQALSVSIDERIDQLRVNLERARRSPLEDAQRLVRVNTAAFTLDVLEGGDSVLSMKVITGRRDRRTPVFEEQLEYLVFNPYWNVPARLAVRDLIPAQIDNPDYFRDRGFRVFSGWQAGASELDIDTIDWRRFLQGAPFKYKLRQEPGPRNALGKIKFMMPNDFGIYLHDTPARRLFGHDRRTFSSGCIRLEKPMALASYLLGGDSAARRMVERFVESGFDHAVKLPRVIPVQVVYRTAWVDASGRLQFRKDVYGRDAALLAQLESRDPTDPQRHSRVKTDPQGQATVIDRSETQIPLPM